MMPESRSGFHCEDTRSGANVTRWYWGQKYDTANFSALRAHEILKRFSAEMLYDFRKGKR